MRRSVRNNYRKITNRKNKKSNYRKNKKSYRKKRGGDVYNNLFCKKGLSNNPRPALHPEDYPDENSASVALEYFESIDEPFEVNKEKENLDKLLTFRKQNLKWFKFLIFIINDITYIYAIYGFPKVNKHPLCYLFGIIEKTGPDEYLELKKAFYDVKLLKDNKTPNINEYTPEIIELNSQIFANLGCMKVKSAGSGTVLNDNIICINNKSGHFKAKFSDIDPYAKDLFAEKTGLSVQSVPAASTEQITNFLDINHIDRKLANRYSGLCI
jgi:hypothetical protein